MESQHWKTAYESSDELRKRVKRDWTLDYLRPYSKKTNLFTVVSITADDEWCISNVSSGAVLDALEKVAKENVRPIFVFRDASEPFKDARTGNAPVARGKKERDFTAIVVKDGTAYLIYQKANHADIVDSVLKSQGYYVVAVAMGKYSDWRKSTLTEVPINKVRGMSLASFPAVKLHGQSYCERKHL